MFGLRIVTQSYLDLMEKELNYYRDAFASQRREIERLTDSILADSGRMPISDSGVEQNAMRTKIMLKRDEEMKELFSDESVDISDVLDSLAPSQQG